MNGTQIILPLSRGSSPIPPAGGDREERLLTLADELSEREDIPIEVAYSIASRHHTTHMESAHERSA